VEEQWNSSRRSRYGKCCTELVLATCRALLVADLNHRGIWASGSPGSGDGVQLLSLFEEDPR
jgi:hypothetical protein